MPIPRYAAAACFLGSRSHPVPRSEHSRVRRRVGGGHPRKPQGLQWRPEQGGAMSPLCSSATIPLCVP